jgi:hypothetical protein
LLIENEFHFKKRLKNGCFMEALTNQGGLVSAHKAKNAIFASLIKSIVCRYRFCVIHRYAAQNRE